MPFGVTPSGFVLKELDDIKSEVEAHQRANLHPALDQSATSVVGQINGSICPQIAEAWETLQGVYLARTRDGADGTNLDEVGALTGTVRDAAVKSTIVGVQVNINAGVVLNPGDAIAHVDGDTSARFVNTETADNSAGGSPANFLIDFEAEAAGPLEAPAGTLTEIAEPVAGWNSVTNANDATIGSDIEDDEGYRVSQEAELRASGSGPVEAIRADLLQVEDVTSARVFENPTDAVDADGRPPHSIEAVVLGGDSTDVATAIFDSKAAGIETVGTTLVNVTDNQGQVHAIRYNVATEMPVYIDVDVDVHPDEYPSDGDAQIQAALAAYSQANWLIGIDVIVSQISKTVFTIDGVIDVTAIRLDFSASPVATANLTVDNDEIATLQSSDVVVASNAVYPP